ncbi:MAG: hypothetical protein AB7E39_01325 [Endomicrobiaceae bacterium]
MSEKNNYKKFKFMFLLSTFAGVAGLYTAYKFQTPAAKYISYFLYTVWFVIAVYVRIAILKNRKKIKQ